MSDNEYETQEAFYDAEIAPVLLELGKKCKERGLPFMAAVQWDLGEPGEGVGKTLMMPGNAKELTADAALIYIAMKVRGNLDSLVMNAKRLPHAEGHNSVVLAMMDPDWPRLKSVTPPMAAELSPNELRRMLGMEETDDAT